MNELLTYIAEGGTGAGGFICFLEVRLTIYKGFI